MKRHFKLLPETFAKAMTLGLLDTKNITEEVIAEKCSGIQNGVVLSKQAIQDRLAKSVPFLKELLKRSFSLIYTNALEQHASLLLRYFADVKVLDATTLSLPDQVKDDYVGMGGHNAEAALKIQTLYSAINHTITHLDITSGVTHNSQCLTEIINKLSKNDLFLADLGYFDKEFLRKLNENNFFISRIKANLKFYNCVSQVFSIYDQIDLVAMLKQSTHSIDKDVYIGNRSNAKLKVRLVGIKLPDEIAHKRIKKAIAQNNGQDISKDKRELLHWNLMVTNVNSDVLSSVIITDIYRIRWQIELLFKVLKSTLSIDKLHLGKTKYIEALLYGRLVGILITMPLYDCLDQSLLIAKGIGQAIRVYGS